MEARAQASAKKLEDRVSGSSARKIKNNAANLLAGRAFVYHLEK